MRKLAIMLLVTPMLAFASIHSTIPPGKWQCLAFDLKEHSFPGIAVNPKNAMKDAKLLCQQKSSLPRSCKTAQSFCEQGPLSLMGETCLVTDDGGHSWDTTGDHACKSAMELCTQFQFFYNLATQCNIKHREF